MTAYAPFGFHRGVRSFLHCAPLRATRRRPRRGVWRSPRLQRRSYGWRPFVRRNALGVFWRRSQIQFFRKRIPWQPLQQLFWRVLRPPWLRLLIVGRWSFQCSTTWQSVFQLLRRVLRTRQLHLSLGSQSRRLGVGMGMELLRSLAVEFVGLRRLQVRSRLLPRACPRRAVERTTIGRISHASGRS